MFSNEGKSPDNAALDKNQFSCALNHYVLPVSPQDPPKNIRSELTEEECQNMLEIVYLPRGLQHHNKDEVKKATYEFMDISAKERELFHLTSDNWYLNHEENESSCSDLEEHEDLPKNGLPFDLPENLISTEI